MFDAPPSSPKTPLAALVSKTIAEYQLLERGQPLWVAVSGGVDSVALAHLLHSLGYGVHLLHLDHGLRPWPQREAERDLVLNLGRQLGVPVRVDTLEVPPKSSEPGHSPNTQARKARYAAFDDATLDYPTTLATAHHQDDNAETVLMGLMRSQAPRLMKGIEPTFCLPGGGRVVRPLLAVGRGQLLAYARHHGLVWAEDPTNANLHYPRSRARHQVLPALQDLHPKPASHLVDLAERYARQYRVLVPVLEAEQQRRLKRMDYGYYWSLAGLDDNPSARDLNHLALEHWLQGLGMNRAKGRNRVLELIDATPDTWVHDLENLAYFTVNRSRHGITVAYFYYYLIVPGKDIITTDPQSTDPITWNGWVVQWGDAEAAKPTPPALDVQLASHALDGKALELFCFPGQQWSITLPGGRVAKVKKLTQPLALDAPQRLRSWRLVDDDNPPGQEILLLQTPQRHWVGAPAMPQPGQPSRRLRAWWVGEQRTPDEPIYPVVP